MRIYTYVCVHLYIYIYTHTGEGLSLKQEMQKLLNHSEEAIEVDFSGQESGRGDNVASPDGKPTTRYVCVCICMYVHALCVCVCDVYI